MHRLPSEYPTAQHDPYNILGVTANDSMNNINIAYKKLIKLLHPDRALTMEARKLGWTVEEKNDAFFLVKESYKEIVNERKYIDQQAQYPDYEINYEIEQDYTNNIEEHIDPKKFNTEHFNTKFDENLKKDRLNGFEDPYSRGYEMFSGGNSTEDHDLIRRTNKRADVIIDKNPKVVQRTLENGALVKYDYFADQNCLTTGTCQVSELGLSQVSDFSITLKNGNQAILYGTDLMSAYGQNNEFWEDSVARDASLSTRYNDTSDITKKMNNYKSTREQAMERDPLLELEEIKNKKLMEKQMADRLSYLGNVDKYYSKKNIGNTLPTRF